MVAYVLLRSMNKRVYCNVYDRQDVGLLVQQIMPSKRAVAQLLPLLYLNYLAMLNIIILMDVPPNCSWESKRHASQCGGSSIIVYRTRAYSPPSAYNYIRIYYTDRQTECSCYQKQWIIKIRIRRHQQYGIIFVGYYPYHTAATGGWRRLVKRRVYI